MPVKMLSDRAGYIPGGVNIGVAIVSDTSCALIDTGLNDTSAKKALKAIDADLGLQVEHILSTHAHADHFGGNAAVVKRTGARVFAPELDEAIIRNPILLPSLLYGGAAPPGTLKGRFLLSKPSPVDVVITESSFELGDLQIDVVRLPGHSPCQVGFVVDGVFFAADVVLPTDALEKYRIPYLYSVTDQLASLDVAFEVDANKVVPGHGPVQASIESLVAVNRALLMEVTECIVACVRTPQTAEAIFASLIAEFDAPVLDAPSYFLLHPTIYAFLSWLEEEGRVSSRMLDRKMVWEAA